MGVTLDKPAYRLLLTYKQSTVTTDKRGLEGDFEFLNDDLWLQDSVVQERVIKLNGTWNIFLVFIHMDNPFLLIQRFIKTQLTHKKATLDAVYMRRLAGKDQRGTLVLDTKPLQLCSN